MPEQPPFKTSFINTQTALNEFCAALEGSAFITVDTEFLRERTYYPKLCLLQVAGENVAAAIDPLADGLDLTPIYTLLLDEKILKVMHAGRQDMEIFYNLLFAQHGRLPAPVADTQIMAMVCGYGESVSYENLASKLARARIDKSSRFTDWSRRPLTPAQIDYALADVTHLRTVFVKLELEIASAGRQEWIKEELTLLTTPATYALNPDDAWQRIKLRGTVKPRVAARLHQLAAWREREAQRHDIPRGRVVRDEALQEIASTNPSNESDLGKVRGLNSGFAEGRLGQEILAILKAIETTPDAALAANPLYAPPAAKPAIYDTVGPTADLLRVLLKQIAQESNVAAKLLATSDELDEIAATDEAKVPALTSPWRRALFGNKALALKHGKLALTLKNRRVVLVENEA